jgi:hypothetical protein
MPTRVQISQQLRIICTICTPALLVVYSVDRDHLAVQLLPCSRPSRSRRRHHLHLYPTALLYKARLLRLDSAQFSCILQYRTTCIPDGRGFSLNIPYSAYSSTPTIRAMVRSTIITFALGVFCLASRGAAAPLDTRADVATTVKIMPFGASIVEIVSPLLSFPWHCCSLQHGFRYNGASFVMKFVDRLSLYYISRARPVTGIFLDAGEGCYVFANLHTPLLLYCVVLIAHDTPRHAGAPISGKSSKTLV